MKANNALEVSELMIQRFEAEFPALDVRQTIRELQLWWDANPRKRKKPENEYRFLVNNLSRTHAKVAAARAAVRSYARVGAYQERQAPDYSKEVADILERHPDLKPS